MNEKKQGNVTRRAALAGMAGAAGTVLARTTAGQDLQVSGASRPVAPDDPTRVLGSRWSTELGKRSPYEQLKRVPSRALTSSETPLQDLHGTITPADLHFERHHAGVPFIDPEKHRLVIHGMVERPMSLSVSDLKRFPAVSRICFLECSGNLYHDAPEDTTAQLIAGMTSQSEWTGVTLSTLMREVGVKPESSWFLAEGADAAVLTRSIPKSLWDEAMIVYAQNGEAVRPENGYPIRLLNPGCEGNSSVKWLRRLEFSDSPFMTREETAKYTEPVRGGVSRQFSFVMDARSIITYPSYPDTVEKGWIEIQGIAWSGRGRISAVDVSTDDGRSWQRAVLQQPVLAKAHVRFRHLFEWTGKETVIMSRAIDESGYVQPSRAEWIAARGPGSGPYHRNPITGWRLKSGGDVVYRVEDWA
ncbi:MAG: sulfite dehydrogenase [Woeseiaceae bacterium]|nr:sulfite dehydrogenase [Woeseiaceae bacterium]